MKNYDMIQYDNIYDEIRETLLNSRSQAYSAVNFALVQAYCKRQIGIAFLCEF